MSDSDFEKAMQNQFSEPWSGSRDHPCFFDGARWAREYTLKEWQAKLDNIFETKTVATVHIDANGDSHSIDNQVITSGLNTGNVVDKDKQLEAKTKALEVAKEALQIMEPEFPEVCGKALKQIEEMEKENG